MRNKGISTVIATILMLMITIGLGGTAYLFISGTFTSKTAATFEVIDEVNGIVTIRNSGTETITRITATLDGNSENIAVVPNMDGLVAYWSLNEGSGTSTDDNSPNNNIGTLNGGLDSTGWTDGKSGKALQFDGSNDYVNIPNSPTTNFGTGAFTLSTWVRTSSPTNGIIIDTSTTPSTFNQMKRLAIENNGKNIAFYVRSSGGNPDLTINVGLNDGNWHYVVGTYDSNVRKLYFDGSLVGSDTSAIGNTDTAQPWRMGSALGGSVPFTGLMDEVAIYNKALSESEIKQLYSGLVSPGQLATIKPLTSLSKGTHTLRLCAGGSCNTAILTIQ